MSTYYFVWEKYATSKLNNITHCIIINNDCGPVIYSHLCNIWCFLNENQHIFSHTQYTYTYHTNTHACTHTLKYSQALFEKDRRKNVQYMNIIAHRLSKLNFIITGPLNKRHVTNSTWSTSRLIVHH